MTPTLLFCLTSDNVDTSSYIYIYILSDKICNGYDLTLVLGRDLSNVFVRNYIILNIVVSFLNLLELILFL